MFLTLKGHISRKPQVHNTCSKQKNKKIITRLTHQSGSTDGIGKALGDKKMEKKELQGSRMTHEYLQALRYN